MTHRFFNLTLWNRPLREYRAARREVVGVLAVIVGVGGPLSLAADAFLSYGMAAAPALAARRHWPADALAYGTLAVFLALMGLVMAVTGRLARRFVLQSEHEHDQR